MIQVWALVVLCSWAKHYTHTVPLTWLGFLQVKGKYIICTQHSLPQSLSPAISSLLTEESAKWGSFSLTKQPKNKPQVKHEPFRPMLPNSLLTIIEAHIFEFWWVVTTLLHVTSGCHLLILLNFLQMILYDATPP